MIRKKSAHGQAIAAILVAVVGVSNLGCGSGCGNDVITRLKSADGQLEAVLYQRSCGATTDFTTQVIILPAGKALPDDPEPVFVADTNHGAAPSAKWGGPPASIEWQGERKLLIQYHSASRVFRAQATVTLDLGRSTKTAVSIEASPAANLGSPPNSTLSPSHSRVTPLAQEQQAARRGARGLA